ncbi:hypothetical protein ATANTOWER_024944 [Ataeniobius toweri]|uniref:Uncharacterized protein n=1 Tax=Ataeniobius toweri TaxID=208326 RepID=A0ABU7BSA1_9TELE|nr:hypothetical protein [Ataeniobius toweri]
MNVLCCAASDSGERLAKLKSEQLPDVSGDRVLQDVSTMLYTLAGGGTLCGVAALVLLIVSTATDFWMQYRYSGSSANQGLWRFCINHKCHAHTITVGMYLKRYLHINFPEVNLYICWYKSKILMTFFSKSDCSLCFSCIQPSGMLPGPSCFWQY